MPAEDGIQGTSEQVIVIAAKAAIQKGGRNSFTYEMTAVTPILAFPHQGGRDLFKGSPAKSLLDSGPIPG